MIKFKIPKRNITEVQRLVKNKAEKYNQRIADKVNTVAFAIHRDAIANIDKNKTVDTGILRSKTQVDIATAKNPIALVYSGTDYAPFVEFGTKSKVSVPAELKSYARQFKGSKKGSFDELLKKIEKWANRKGLPREAVFPIALSIARNGTSAKPFLFPAYFKNRKNFIKAMRGVKI